jgi:transposase
MKRWQTREELTVEVLALRRDGLSRRAIARSLGVSRNTVRKILRTHSKSRSEPHTALPVPPKRAPRAKKTDEYGPRVERLLEKYDNITAQRVFEIIVEDGYAGGYTAVKELVRRLRPKQKRKPSLKTPEWGPGKMAESDWSSYDVPLVCGHKLKVQLFAYVLVYSRRKYYQAFERYDVHALMAGHAETFDRFGGAAECCKYDGQAAVARWEGNQPVYNPRFLAFCAHYEMRPWALRGNPNLRPNVERGFWTHERSFLVAREFRDLEDFRQQLRYWLDHTVDHRRRKGTSALERFANEAPHLVPLPRHPYDTARVLYRVCSIDGFVDYGGNRYAVPYDHVTDILPLRITERELFVYAADFQCVARHELAERGGHHDIDPQGLHQRRSRRPAIDLDQLLVTYQGMGEGAAEFFRMLSDGPARTWSAVARRILTLRERYATDDLDAALGHAARYGAFGYESVQRILEARHRPRRLDEYVAAETASKLQAELGQQRTARSDLTEYDRLPGTCPKETADGDDDNDESREPDDAQQDS